MNNAKTVNILIDGQGNVHVRPDVVRISISRAEQVAWHCLAGVTFEIQFRPGACPFDCDRFRGGSGGALVSPPPRPGSESDKAYKYDVIVEFEGGRRAVRDPGVIVEP